MPGDIYLGSLTGYGAGAGYAPMEPAPTVVAAASHSSFIVWLVVFLLVALAIQGGLRVGGFTFVFKRG